MATTGRFLRPTWNRFVTCSASRAGIAGIAGCGSGSRAVSGVATCGSSTVAAGRWSVIVLAWGSSPVCITSPVVPMVVYDRCGPGNKRAVVRIGPTAGVWSAVARRISWSWA